MTASAAGNLMNGSQDGNDGRQCKHKLTFGTVSAEGVEYRDSLDLFKQMLPDQDKFRLLDLADSLNTKLAEVDVDAPRAGPWARLLQRMLSIHPCSQGPSFLGCEAGLNRRKPRGYLNPVEHAILLVGSERLREMLSIVKAQPFKSGRDGYMWLFTKKEMKALAMVLGRRNSGNKKALASELISWRREVTGWPCDPASVAVV